MASELRASARPLSPLTQLTAAAVIAITTTAVNSWTVSAAVLLVLAVLPAVLPQLHGLGRRVLPAAAVIMIPFWLSLLLTHGLFFHEGRTVLWEWGPARMTSEGLLFAADVGLRTAVAVVVFLAFSFSVCPADLMALLTRYRVPPQLGFVLCSTLTIAPSVMSRAHRIGQAQEARGLVAGAGLGGRIRAVRQQAVPLVLALLHESGSRAHALEARGFGGRGVRTSYREVPDSGAQRVFRWAALVSMLLFLLLWYVPALRAQALQTVAMPGLLPGGLPGGGW
ncbi:energy-coupling factor transporter transmembrane component T family protein [Arthrobacter sp. A5]|uniref:energy-coupling factor transporter transmembrane component T family protein n=1 Tax=Arthrobacter sp. A5 TaxID=576926 RepID=UPI003DA8C59B